MDPQIAPTDVWTRAASGDADARDELASYAHELAGRELRRKGVARADLEALQQEAVISVLAYLEEGGEIRESLAGFLKFRAWGVLSDYRNLLNAQC